MTDISKAQNERAYWIVLQTTCRKTSVFRRILTLSNEVVSRNRYPLTLIRTYPATMLELIHVGNILWTTKYSPRFMAWKPCLEIMVLVPIFWIRLNLFSNDIGVAIWIHKNSCKYANISERVVVFDMKFWFTWVTIWPTWIFWIPQFGKTMNIKVTFIFAWIRVLHNELSLVYVDLAWC